MSQRDALTNAVSRWPWRTGEPLTPAEGAMLRRYVAGHPWRPGVTGNGIVSPLGSVVTWAIYDENGEPDLEGAPWHESVIRALYPQTLGEYGDVRAAFTVDVDGSWDDDRGTLPDVEWGRITDYLAKLAP
jgi:hypothetical protein